MAVFVPAPSPSAHLLNSCSFSCSEIRDHSCIRCSSQQPSRVDILTSVSSGGKGGTQDTVLCPGAQAGDLPPGPADSEA